MIMSNILTIVIPTYNRAKKLEKSLGRNLSIGAKYADSVQFLVTDNNSPDDTENVVKNYQRHFPQLLSYHKQPKNIGFDNNFFDGARRATTKYICLMGDDDTITPSYFETIFYILKKYPELGWINYNVMDVSYGGHFIGMRDKDINEHYYPEGCGLMRDHQETPSLISSNVFLREEFLKIHDCTTTLNYEGYNWLYCMFRAFIHKPCFYYGFPIAMDGKPEGGPDWNYKFPIYFLYGMGRMFKELDAEDPGLYKVWSERQFAPGYTNTENLLFLVSTHRDYYKGENFRKIYPYIESDYYRKRFTWAVKYPLRFFLLLTKPEQMIIYYTKRLFSSIRLFRIRKK